MTVLKDDVDKLRLELKTKIEAAEPKQGLIESDADDEQLVRFAVLNELKNRDKKQDGDSCPDEGAVMEQIQNTPLSLLKQMLLADGAKGGQYGRALQIYQEILKESDKAAAGEDDSCREDCGSTNVLNRLALAIALEHAVKLPQDNPKEPPPTEDDKFVDPVKRYLNYESAFEDGDLDPAFETLTVWELRMVVDGNEPDETLAWGRQMLRIYKPENVLRRDYCRTVNTNIQYGSHRVKNDQPNLQLYQNILMNGGICGRRAFFGRFILRAFGIPTTARPSPGHGALVHWTPDNGWTPKLGPGWGKGWTKGIYGADVNFLATTQAREDPKDYWKVKRAQWIGSVMEERAFYGKKDNHLEKKPEDLKFWFGLSLSTQDKIIEDLKGNKKKDQVKITKRTILERCLATKASDKAKTIVYNDDKTIVIPAAAFGHPRGVKHVETVDCMDLNEEGEGAHPLQIYLPAFNPQGLTIMRGGTWKSPPSDCRAGFRLPSAGYGHYHDWGFRIACGHFDQDPAPTMTVDLDDEKGNTAQMEFVYIPPGTFLMGGTRTDDGKWCCVEVPKHEVTLTKGFYLGKYPVTQAQYQVMMGNNPSKSTKDPNCPVDDISVDAANDFCEKMVDTIGKEFRLPTEAEWEYACRGGVKEDWKHFFGDGDEELGDYAWFKGNSGGHSHPVGQKKPNPFGLYDIFGNVLERVSDKYHKDYYAKSPSVDPTGYSQGVHSIFDYVVKVPEDGTYSLIAEVATANAKQTLNLLVGEGNVTSDTEPTVVLTLPFTCAMWQDSPSVEVSLKAGNNMLRFWRDKPPQYGVAVKKFRLEPV